MVQTEGYAALMSGVSATVARGLFYGGRLSVADPAASPLHPQLAAIFATRYVSRCHIPAQQEIDVRVSHFQLSRTWCPLLVIQEGAESGHQITDDFVMCRELPGCEMSGSTVSDAKKSRLQVCAWACMRP